MPTPKSRAIACQIVPLRDVLVTLPALLFLAGCGGTVGAAGSSSPEGGAVLDAGADRAAPLDCSTAVEGAPCDLEGAICRDTCAPCAICGFLGCGGGHWSLGSDVPPPSCFVNASADAHDANVDDAAVSASTIPCGPSADGGLQLCAFPQEYCEESGGGPPPPPDAGPYVSYACVKMPAACAPSPTCTCLTSSAKNALCGGAGGALIGCTASDAGATVSCGFP